jgi:hypothetical protein
MKAKLNRRRFLSASALASAGAGLSFEAGASGPVGEQSAGKKVVEPCSKGTLPTGTIGKLTISRLISGGNLISGWAHSRDLFYVPSLMRHYHTPEKILETLQLLEEHGVNAIIDDPRDNVKELLLRYRQERGGKIQWIAQGLPDALDWKTSLQECIDFGAAAVYVQGVKADEFYNAHRLELLGKSVEFVKSRGLPSGIGAHKLEVIIESEKNQFGADFYVKTLHQTDYWSARRPDQQADVINNPADNYWDLDPQRTISFMQTVKKPWIAFKVLAAGAIRPESGFRHAFANGADFICVGMFDFQVEQDVALVRKLMPRIRNRERDWMA